MVEPTSSRILQIEEALSDGSRRNLGANEFATIPALNDRILLATGSPDIVDQYRVLFIEHSPGPYPRSTINFPPRAVVVIEYI